MSDALHLGLPVTLSRLQSASEGAERDTAWADFSVGLMRAFLGAGAQNVVASVSECGQ